MPKVGHTQNQDFYFCHLFCQLPFPGVVAPASLDKMRTDSVMMSLVLMTGTHYTFKTAPKGPKGSIEKIKIGILTSEQLGFLPWGPSYFVSMKKPQYQKYTKGIYFCGSSRKKFRVGLNTS